MTHYEIITKLIGPIQPIGDSNADEKRRANMETMLSLIEDLVADVRDIANSPPSHEASVQSLRGTAMLFMRGLHEETEGF
jgi:hypothetical protein